MTTPRTVADERGTLDEEQQPPGEANDLEAVRAYMRQLLEAGRGEEAIELLLGLLGQAARGALVHGGAAEARAAASCTGARVRKRRRASCSCCWSCSPGRARARQQ